MQKPAGMRAALAPAAIELKAERRVAGVARRASVVTYVRRRRRDDDDDDVTIAWEREPDDDDDGTRRRRERVKRGIDLARPSFGLIAVSETRFTVRSRAFSSLARVVDA